MGGQATAERGWQVALREKPESRLEIAVYDVIGKDFFGEGVNAKDVLVQLRSAPSAKNIDLRINSIGGIVDEAKAMVNLLAQRTNEGATVTAYVDGIAASAAAYLTTAASRVIVPSNAFLMLHESRARAGGRAGDFEAFAAVMRKTNAQIAEAFAEASARRGKKKSKDDYLAAMAKGDLYLTADEAIEWGLADEQTEPVKVAACLADVGDLELLPEGLREHLRSAPYVITAQAEPVPPAPRIEHQPAPIPGPTPALPGKNGETMDQKVLAKLLKLPEAATEGEITAELERLTAPVAEAAAPVLRQLGVTTQEAGASRAQELQRVNIALLSATGANTTEQALAQIGTWKTMADQTAGLLKQVATLSEAKNKAEIEGAIAKFSASGQLPPSAHEYARINCLTAAAVEQLALSLPKFGAAPHEQTTKVTALTDEDRQICRLTGVSEEDYLEQKKLETQQRAGASAEV